MVRHGCVSMFCSCNATCRTGKFDYNFKINLHSVLSSLSIMDVNMTFNQFMDAMAQQFTALGHSLNGTIVQYQQLKSFFDQLPLYCHTMPTMPQAWSAQFDVSSPQAFSAVSSSMPQASSAPVGGVMPQAWCSPVGPSPPSGCCPFPQR